MHVHAYFNAQWKSRLVIQNWSTVTRVVEWAYNQFCLENRICCIHVLYIRLYKRKHEYPLTSQ